MALGALAGMGIDVNIVFLEKCHETWVSFNVIFTKPSCQLRHKLDMKKRINGPKWRDCVVRSRIT